MRGKREGHELPPSQIKTLRVAQNHLCSLANDHGKLKPEMCERCDVFCKYGERMLEIIGRPIPKRCASDETVAKLYRQGEALPTLRARLKNRHK